MSSIERIQLHDGNRAMVFPWLQNMQQVWQQWILASMKA